MKRVLRTLGPALGLLLLTGLAGAADPAPAEPLSQLVQQLQKTPDDGALREKVIASALARRPAPAIPEEARRFLARGLAAVESAKSPSDLKLALPEFTNARDAAPWWPVVYFNLALVQEKLSDFKGALADYHLYLAAAPDAKDAEKVRTQIYKLEFLAEKKAAPKDILLSFTGDASGSGMARSSGGDLPFDLKSSIEDAAIALLQSRFPGARINAADAGDPALTVTINEHDTAWDHSCGIFSCDVSLTSQILISASTPAGLHADRPFRLDLTRNVSKGNSSFGPQLFYSQVPQWIGQEVMKDLQGVLDEEAVRKSLGDSASK